MEEDDDGRVEKDDDEDVDKNEDEEREMGRFCSDAPSNQGEG